MLKQIAVLGLLAFSMDDCEELLRGHHGGKHGDEPIPCAEEVRTNWAGQHIDSGTVSVHNTATDLVITIEGDHGWLVDAWHVYAGTSAVPTTRSGSPAPGQFPYQGNPNPAQQTVTITIPLADIVDGCDEWIHIAVHTEMVKHTSKGTKRETGWADWDFAFKRSWGGSFGYGVCCVEEPPPPECTQYFVYWLKNPSAWPVTSLVLGGETYDQAELLAILGLDGSVDASVQLAQQLIAARLNQASGLPVPAHVLAEMDAADTWLMMYADADGRLPFGIAMGTPEANAASQTTAWLHSYNSGYEGVPYCGDSW